MAARKLNVNHAMDLAIEVMANSVDEVRADGKASPRVGAVMWKAGVLHTACRGELREGDHAEFTLLERKHRSDRLDGAVLFSTLEPCAPGSRKHPKMSCAERIVLARIKEVWVGIEDPDPTVDRKGIKYLQDHGVTVHMFDSTLQERIREANKDFIAQAVERAARAREVAPAAPVVLSRYELPLPHATWEDFDSRAIREYQTAWGDQLVTEDGVTLTTESGQPIAVEGIPSLAEIRRRLVLQGLAAERGSEIVPTGFGAILFGKHPRVHVPQAGLLATITYENGDEETRDFDGPAVAIPEEAIAWLRAKLPDPIHRGRPRRMRPRDVFYELVREGIANALVHRDYTVEGAKIHVVATRDKIVIKSPGLPVDPITMEQLAALEAPALSRNPVMHYVFGKMKLAEERGLGLRSMRDRASAADLPRPSYRYEAPYVELTLYPDAAAAAVDLPTRGPSGELSEGERDGWAWLVTQQTVTALEYGRAMRVPERTARFHLKRFVDLGLLRTEGSARSRRYAVVPR